MILILILSSVRIGYLYLYGCGERTCAARARLGQPRSGGGMSREGREPTDVGPRQLSRPSDLSLCYMLHLSNTYLTDATLLTIGSTSSSNRVRIYQAHESAPTRHSTTPLTHNAITPAANSRVRFDFCSLPKLLYGIPWRRRLLFVLCVPW